MKKELDVAILMDDLEVASEISVYLRKTGVIPHFYENFRSFWYGTHETVPTLALVDVTLMSKGDLSLHDHPRVKSDEMNLLFYHTDATSPLLFSTYDLWHLGTINGDQNIKGQLKVVLKRLNRKLELERLNNQLSLASNDYEKRINRAVLKANTEKEQAFYKNLLIDLCSKFDESALRGDFFEICKNAFSTSELIKSFSILELAPGEQRLVSARIESDKYIEIPALWLGNKCDHGIELFAQNLATQVAIELYDSELMVLAIKGLYGNPEKLIFVSSDSDEFLSNFNWDFVERCISGLYSRLELKRSINNRIESTSYDCWKLMDVVDGEFFKSLGEEGTQKLVNINFDRLIKTVRQRPDVRFFWNKFFEEFKSRMTLSLDFDFKFAPMGISDLGILIPAANDACFDQIKNFSSSFPFWRFFENTDLTIGKDLTPEVRMVPMSGEAYFNFLSNKEVTYTRSSQSTGFIDHKVVVDSLKANDVFNRGIQL